MITTPTIAADPARTNQSTVQVRFTWDDNMTLDSFTEDDFDDNIDPEKPSPTSSVPKTTNKISPQPQ